MCSVIDWGRVSCATRAVSRSLGRWTGLFFILCLSDCAKQNVIGATTPAGEVILISDKENTSFRYRPTQGGAWVALGKGKIVTVNLPNNLELEVEAETDGYLPKPLHFSSPPRRVAFYFLVEDRCLTLISAYSNTVYRYRSVSSDGRRSRWEEIGENGTQVKKRLPTDGNFEVEARLDGFLPKIEPVLDRTGKIAFKDFVRAVPFLLVSNEEFTQFRYRDLGRDGEWEEIGRGTNLSVALPAEGKFDVSAKPPSFREQIVRTNHLTGLDPAKYKEAVIFTFTDKDREIK